mmetsp:Transcript_8842/g.17496  ORF Transcript_8842/g.17496 Transcript_8842/m.17496 type:complete len:543 (-) Transcript_8842:1232-2860(-)
MSDEETPKSALAENGVDATASEVHGNETNVRETSKDAKEHSSNANDSVKEGSMVKELQHVAEKNATEEVETNSQKILQNQAPKSHGHEAIVEPANGHPASASKKETVPYLKKLLSVAKRSIDDLKRKLQQKDDSIAEYKRQNETLQEQLERVKDLTRRAQRRIEELEGKLEDFQGESQEPGCPIATRLRVKDEAANIVWCLVETSPGVTEWVEEEEVYDRVGTTSTPFPMPALSLTVDESSTLAMKEAQVTQELEELRDKFRKYKMKAEMNLKRKDAEVTRLSENNLKYKQHNITGHDYYSQLEYSRREIEKLSKALDESAAEAAALRKRNQDLDRKLRDVDADQQALLKRIQYLENVDANGEAGEHRGRGVSRSNSSGVFEVETGSSKHHAGGRRNSELTAENNALLEKHYNLLEQHAKLRDEYDKFREHARALLESKTSQDNHGNDANGSHLSSPALSPASSSVAEQAAAATQAATEREYIKNIFIKYLCAGEGPEKETIEAALATALRFSPDQVKMVQDQKSHAALAHAATSGFSRLFF